MPKCYYELLEVERDADADTIKKSYRKMALKWHPDKNPSNIEEATKMFAVLQQAYETLSDTQERAWYDRHREQIIRGGFDDDNYKDDSIDLLKYHCKCWDGFGDNKKGFFAVYREVFETLTEEDRDFHDDPKDGNYPQFGDSNSDPEEIVSNFYGFWQSFCTVRSFTWVEEYDIRQAPNRPTMRAMEKENEKMRQAAKAERNEQIRDLTSFIRKKDPRVVAYREKLEEKKKETQRKNEERMRQQRIDNFNNLKVHKESEESKEAWRRKMEEIEDELDEREGGLSDLSDEDEEGDEPYCIVCEKSFKSLKTKENHEKSKAHKLKLAELKKHMKEEDAALLLEGMGEAEDGEEQEQVDNTPRGKKSKKARKKEKERRKQEEEENEEKNEEDLTEATEGLTLEEKEKEEEEDEEKKEDNIFLTAAKAPVKKEKKKGKADATINVKEPVKGGATVPKTALCDKCGEFFESRSQLFAHLKETGHATPLVMQGGGGKKNKGKKGKKGNDDW